MKYIETGIDLDNETVDNEEYHDTVLDNFYQKTDTGNGVRNVVAEQIEANCANNKSHSGTNRCKSFN